MLAKLSKELVLVAGLAQAALGLAVSFGFKLSAEQVGATAAVVAALSAVVVRTQVTPTTPAVAPPPAAVPAPPPPSP